jgi:predicted GNAT superfamily acetyltransferase
VILKWAFRPKQNTEAEVNLLKNLSHARILKIDWYGSTEG